MSADGLLRDAAPGGGDGRVGSGALSAGAAPAGPVAAAPVGVLAAAGALAAAAVVGVAGLLAAQAARAAGRPYLPAAGAPAPAGRWGDPAAPAVELLVLGDSTAAGVGVDHVDDSVGGRLAALLAAGGLRVHLAGAAVAGSRTGDLGPQVSRALLGRRGRPAVAVVLIGANDATHLTALPRVRRGLRSAVGRLVAAGVPVAVGTCPDLGATRALPRPLRDLVALRGRRLARVQAGAARACGALTVDIAALTGPSFRRDPRLLAVDEFHPSAAGYDLWARALLPTVRQLVDGLATVRR